MEKINNQNDNNQVAEQQKKDERNQTDSRDASATTTIQDLIGGDAKVEEIKNRVESDDEQGEPIVARSSEIDEAQYPKNPEIVTNTKFTYGD